MDFTLSNARQFYSSMGNPLGVTRLRTSLSPSKRLNAGTYTLVFFFVLFFSWSIIRIISLICLFFFTTDFVSVTRGTGHEGHEGLEVAWHKGHMARLQSAQTFPLIFFLTWVAKNSRHMTIEKH